MGARARLTAASVALAIAVAGAAWAATATGESAQDGNLMVTVNGDITPRKLPRERRAPVAMWVSSRFATTDDEDVPQLRRARIELNRHGRLLTRGLPRCSIKKLRLATTREALRRCRGALVGRGHVSTEIAFPDMALLPSEGRLLAFNARRKGRPVVLTHIFGTDPVPVTYVLPFEVRRKRRGPYGTSLVAQLPIIAGDWGYVTRFTMRLGRPFRVRGKRRSYLSAACAVPRGVRVSLYPLARTTYFFADGRRLATSLNRVCRVRR